MQGKCGSCGWNSAINDYRKERINGGIGTVPLRAIKKRRRGWMCELSTGYRQDSVGYLKAEDERMDMPTLFNFVG